MKKYTILLLLCLAFVLLTSYNLKSLSCKILNKENQAIENAEIIIADYQLFLRTNQQGNFFITHKKLLKDFKKGKFIYIEVRAENYKTNIFRINKTNNLEIRDRLNPLVIEKIKDEVVLLASEKKLDKTKTTIDTIKQIIYKHEKKDVIRATTNNEIGIINNNSTGSITIGDDYTYNEGNKIIKTTIIKEKIVEVVPFEERDCAKKEIGYLKIRNKNFKNSYNIKISNLGKEIGPFTKGWSYYNIGPNTTKFIRTTSENYYVLESENANEKTGMYTQGFSKNYFKDSYYINPCDTHLIVIP